MNIEEKLYTSTEVAKLLGVSLRSVYRYLDQGKIDAEIKTATGRLRFTKKNIEDFLYPNDENVPNYVIDSKNTADISPRTLAPAEVEEDSTQVDEQPLDEVTKPEEVEVPENLEVSETPVEEKPDTEPGKGSDEEDGGEEIDWLAKFRAAARQHTTEVPKEKAEESKESLSALTSEEETITPRVQYKYYKSLLGGLKDIAQNIDKVARRSNVDYAFTLYAGLSLDKPLKQPFSILHSRITSESEDLFKRMLQLEPSDETNAQLCLIISSEGAIFAEKEEKHGLFTVSEEQLKKDFIAMGLGSEYESLI